MTHWIARFSSFCTKSLLHSPSWKADSHTATYSGISRKYRRFLAVHTGARLRNLFWPTKTPVHIDPLYFFYIGTSIAFSSVTGLWKLSFFLRFSDQIFVHISVSSDACHILRTFMLDVPCYSLFTGFCSGRNEFIVHIFAMNIYTHEGLVA
jgi:hypothetical protein